MIKEILGAIEKVNSGPLLVTFLGLSLASFCGIYRPFEGVISAQTLGLAALVFVAFLLLIGWVTLVVHLDVGLEDEDPVRPGALIGCILLAFSILITFFYLASHPQGLALSLLGEPGFVRLCTLYLLAIETMKIR